MRIIRMDNNIENEYYRFNEEHIVCVCNSIKDILCIYVMDNDSYILNHRWCKNISNGEIESIASELLYEIGYNGKIMDNYNCKGRLLYYLPESNDVIFPLEILCRNTKDYCESYKEIIGCSEEYVKAMKKHQENNDNIDEFGTIIIYDIHDILFRMDEYMHGAICELHNLSMVIDELFPLLDPCFENGLFDQLNVINEMNAYLIKKANELYEKLPENFEIVYPDK